jgi:hypothetical protein
MPDISSAVTVLRWLVQQDYRETPAYLVRTRVERAMLALAADISLLAYGERMTSMRLTLVEDYIRGRPTHMPVADDLLLSIAEIFEEFVGFTDVGRYSINARHPNIERSMAKIMALGDRAEAFARSVTHR